MAAARQRENHASRATLDPETKCWLPGVPRATYMGFPFQIVQTPNQTSLLDEDAHTVRNVFMNSQHPKGPIEWWMGDSRGQVGRRHARGRRRAFQRSDLVGQSRQSPQPTAARHRAYRSMSANHIDYEATIEDSKVFTRPWTMRMPLDRRLDMNMQILQ